MVNEKFKYYRLYYNFFRTLARELTSFYYKKLNKPFKVKNKLKGKGFDPVTSSDKALERLPDPTGWRILVLPYKGQGKTKGGIILSDETI